MERRVKARQKDRRGAQYSSHDCGGPDVCAGCDSFRHGIYQDGSGDPQALAVMRRLHGTRERARTSTTR
jgi:hypothetical protein